MGRRATALAPAVALGLLLCAAPSPAQATRGLTVGSATEPFGPVLAAVSLLAWLLAGWLLLLAGVVLLALVPGATGRLLDRLGGWLAPAAIRRCVEACLGLSVLAGGIVAPATAATASPSVLASPLSATTPAVHQGPYSSSELPDLDWAVPFDEPRATSSDRSSPRASRPPSIAALAVPVRPDASLPRARSAPSATATVVQPGDTLWGLAAAQLRGRGDPGPSAQRIAQTWPQWWQANREVIGPDPDLLHPGTALHPPES